MKRIILLFNLILFIFASCKVNHSNAQKSTLSNNKTENNKIENIPKDINLYQLYNFEKNTGENVGFISLSDKYPLSEHKDSLAIPNLERIKAEQKLQYFLLEQKYRKRLFDKTGISESDSLFLYDYATNILLAFPVKKLNVVAKLNDYRNINEYPFSQYDYQIGFEINKHLLDKLDLNYNFVYIGKDNPFVTGQMKPIIWKKIGFNDFPLKKSKLSNLKRNRQIGKAFLYISDKYQYFVHEIRDSSNTVSRHLIITDKQSEKIIIERSFIDGESMSAAPLNYGIDNPDFADSKEQWTGKLLKDKPDVIFGFDWVSFGCPNIIFLHSSFDDIYLNCDNRH